MTTSRDGIVIAGGGLAGQRCGETLRRHGFDGAIRIVCAEPHRPYDRPPLSKGLLTSDRPDDSIHFKSAQWYAEQSIDLLLGVSATGLSPREHCLSLSDGTGLAYDRLLIATGSRPRTLPLLDGYDNVSVLRSLDDARLLRDVLATQPRLAVLGAGFIGQEVAATARKLGAEVTMIEAAPYPLAGVLVPRLGEWFARLHRDEGVDVITGCTAEAVRANGSVHSLRLSNGRSLRVDHVVVGIGVRPEVSWLAGSGLDVSRGVAVDPHGRTELPDILAVGDAAATFDPIARRHVPGSHWEAAGRQAARAARVMLGLDPGAVPLTSFWTDQYGVRIQYLGHAPLADAVRIDGDPEERDFTATFTRAGRAVAALLAGRPHSLPAARKLLEMENANDIRDRDR
jgi:3-phenylpropionate/trans-cinnamate dioxygenase ferredoxin reductase component